MNNFNQKNIRYKFEHNVTLPAQTAADVEICENQAVYTGINSNFNTLLNNDLFIYNTISNNIDYTNHALEMYDPTTLIPEDVPDGTKYLSVEVPADREILSNSRLIILTKETTVQDLSCINDTIKSAKKLIIFGNDYVLAQGKLYSYNYAETIELDSISAMGKSLDITTLELTIGSSLSDNIIIPNDFTSVDIDNLTNIINITHYQDNINNIYAITTPSVIYLVQQYQNNLSIFNKFEINLPVNTELKTSLVYYSEDSKKYDVDPNAYYYIVYNTTDTQNGLNILILDSLASTVVKFTEKLYVRNTYDVLGVHYIFNDDKNPSTLFIQGTDNKIYQYDIVNDFGKPEFITTLQNVTHIDNMINYIVYNNDYYLVTPDALYQLKINNNQPTIISVFSGYDIKFITFKGNDYIIGNYVNATHNPVINYKSLNINSDILSIKLSCTVPTGTSFHKIEITDNSIFLLNNQISGAYYALMNDSIASLSDLSNILTLKGINKTSEYSIEVLSNNIKFLETNGTNIWLSTTVDSNLPISDWSNHTAYFNTISEKLYAEISGKTPQIIKTNVPTSANTITHQLDYNILTQIASQQFGTVPYNLKNIYNDHYYTTDNNTSFGIFQSYYSGETGLTPSVTTKFVRWTYENNEVRLSNIQTQNHLDDFLNPHLSSKSIEKIRMYDNTYYICHSTDGFLTLPTIDVPSDPLSAEKITTFKNLSAFKIYNCNVLDYVRLSTELPLTIGIGEDQTNIDVNYTLHTFLISSELNPNNLYSILERSYYSNTESSDIHEFYTIYGELTNSQTNIIDALSNLNNIIPTLSKLPEITYPVLSDCITDQTHDIEYYLSTELSQYLDDPINNLSGILNTYLSDLSAYLSDFVPEIEKPTQNPQPFIDLNLNNKLYLSSNLIFENNPINAISGNNIDLITVFNNTHNLFLTRKLSDEQINFDSYQLSVINDKNSVLYTNLTSNILFKNDTLLSLLNNQSINNTYYSNDVFYAFTSPSEWVLAIYKNGEQFISTKPFTALNAQHSDIYTMCDRTNVDLPTIILGDSGGTDGAKSHIILKTFDAGKSLVNYISSLNGSTINVNKLPEYNEVKLTNINKLFIGDSKPLSCGYMYNLEYYIQPSADMTNFVQFMAVQLNNSSSTLPLNQLYYYNSKWMSSDIYSDYFVNLDANDNKISSLPTGYKNLNIIYCTSFKESDIGDEYGMYYNIICNTNKSETLSAFTTYYNLSVNDVNLSNLFVKPQVFNGYPQKINAITFEKEPNNPLNEIGLFIINNQTYIGDSILCANTEMSNIVNFNVNDISTVFVTQDDVWHINHILENPNNHELTKNDILNSEVPSTFQLSVLDIEITTSDLNYLTSNSITSSFINANYINENEAVFEIRITDNINEVRKIVTYINGNTTVIDSQNTTITADINYDRIKIHTLDDNSRVINIIGYNNVLSAVYNSNLSNTNITIKQSQLNGHYYNTNIINDSNKLIFLNNAGNIDVVSIDEELPELYTSVLKQLPIISVANNQPYILNKFNLDIDSPTINSHYNYIINTSNGADYYLLDTDLSQPSPVATLNWIEYNDSNSSSRQATINIVPTQTKTIQDFPIKAFIKVKGAIFIGISDQSDTNNNGIYVVTDYQLSSNFITCQKIYLYNDTNKTKQSYNPNVYDLAYNVHQDILYVRNGYNSIDVLDLESLQFDLNNVNDICHLNKNKNSTDHNYLICSGILNAFTVTNIPEQYRFMNTGHNDYIELYIKNEYNKLYATRETTGKHIVTFVQVETPYLSSETDLLNVENQLTNISHIFELGTNKYLASYDSISTHLFKLNDNNISYANSLEGNFIPIKEITNKSGFIKQSYETIYLNKEVTELSDIRLSATYNIEDSKTIIDIEDSFVSKILSGNYYRDVKSLYNVFNVPFFNIFWFCLNSESLSIQNPPYIESFTSYTYGELTNTLQYNSIFTIPVSCTYINAFYNNDKIESINYIAPTEPNIIQYTPALNNISYETTKLINYFDLNLTGDATVIQDSLLTSDYSTIRSLSDTYRNYYKDIQLSAIISGIVTQDWQDSQIPQLIVHYNQNNYLFRKDDSPLYFHDYKQSYMAACIQASEKDEQISGDCEHTISPITTTYQINNYNYIIGTNNGLYDFTYVDRENNSYKDYSFRLNAPVQTIASSYVYNVNYTETQPSAYFVVTNNDIYQLDSTFRPTLYLDLSSANITDFDIHSKYNKVIFTDKGIYTANYQYRLRETNLLDYNNPHQIVDNYYNDLVAEHIKNEHNSEAFITKINNKMPYDFSETDDWLSSETTEQFEIITNDLVNNVKFSDTLLEPFLSVEYLNKDTDNIYLNSDKLTYIIKEYNSGMQEIYIHVPTTQTVYVETNEHLLTYADTQKDNITISKNVTQLKITLNKSLFHLNEVITFNINGTSLPLNIKKPTTNTNGMYQSYILPTLASTHIKYTDTTIELNAVIFGTDAQDIYILAK